MVCVIESRCVWTDVEHGRESVFRGLDSRVCILRCNLGDSGVEFIYLFYLCLFRVLV